MVGGPVHASDQGIAVDIEPARRVSMGMILDVGLGGSGLGGGRLDAREIESATRCRGRAAGWCPGLPGLRTLGRGLLVVGVVCRGEIVVRAVGRACKVNAGVDQGDEGR